MKFHALGPPFNLMTGATAPSGYATDVKHTMLLFIFNSLRNLSKIVVIRIFFDEFFCCYMTNHFSKIEYISLIKYCVIFKLNVLL